MEQEIEEQAELEAVLDLYPYLDVQNKSYTGENLAHIMKE